MKCPECGPERVVNIAYGLPTKETIRNYEESFRGGKDPTFVFGGCMVDSKNPNLHCLNCRHEWATEHLADHRHKKKEEEEST